MQTPQTLTLPDGAVLEYVVDAGAPDASAVLLYHHGTPAAGPLDDPMVHAARANDLRLVELIRPGYGRSTRRPGRTVADVVPLVAALIDELDAERFVTLGWSGGGPHAIATAALLPQRCAGAICLAGVAPFEAAGLNWLAGMGSDNWQEFGAALAGPEYLDRFLTEAAVGLVDVQAGAVIDALASLLSEADRRTLDAGAAATMAAQLRFSVAQGIDGWFDDDLAFLAPWGFDLASLTVPVQVLQGSRDLMVPLAHGVWLADAIPSATRTLLDGEGHLSVASQFGDAFAELSSRLAN